MLKNCNTRCNSQHHTILNHFKKKEHSYTPNCLSSADTLQGLEKSWKKKIFADKRNFPTRIFSTPSRSVKMNELGKKDGRGKTLKQKTFSSLFSKLKFLWNPSSPKGKKETLLNDLSKAVISRMFFYVFYPFPKEADIPTNFITHINDKVNDCVVLIGSKWPYDCRSLRDSFSRLLHFPQSFRTDNFD